MGWTPSRTRLRSAPAVLVATTRHMREMKPEMKIETRRIEWGNPTWRRSVHAGGRPKLRPRSRTLDFTITHRRANQARAVDRTAQRLLESRTHYVEVQS